jgi:hypothetical protein
MEATPHMESVAPEDGVEVVDGVPVPAQVADGPGSDIERAGPGGQIVARQAAAIAATSFLAGAATAAVVRVARGRSAKRLARKRNQPVQVVASRSFLVDVHLLGPRDPSAR